MTQEENRAHLITAQTTGANNPRGSFVYLFFYMPLQDLKVRNVGESYKNNAELDNKFHVCGKSLIFKVLFWECSILTAVVEGSYINSPFNFKVDEH